LWLFSPITFDETNDGWVATSRRGAEGVGVNLKIAANCAESKTVSRRMMARKHYVMTSRHQYCNEDSPSIGNAVRNAHTTRMLKRKAGPFCGDSS
jgi:hypothetical protein